MHILHVIPPKRLSTIVYHLLMQADLSQILHNNVSALNKHVDRLIVVGSTILSISKALLFFKILGAGRTAPSHKSRSEVNVARQLVLILIELLDEVESEHTVT